MQLGVGKIRCQPCRVVPPPVPRYGTGGDTAQGELSSHRPVPCWRSPAGGGALAVPCPPPAAPTCIAFPWGQSLTQQSPEGGTQVPWGTRCPASLLQTPGFVATQAVLEQTQLEVALAVISHEITGLGRGGQRDDSDQGGSCRGAGCGHGAGDGAGRARGPPALTTY